MRMSFQRWARVAVWPVVLGVTGASSAESLQEAWQMALSRDAGYAAVTTELEAAKADRLAAGRTRLPVVDVTGMYTRLKDDPNLDVAAAGGRLESPLWRHDGYASGNVDVSLPLWTSGRLSGAVGAASASVDAAQSQTARAAADLKLAVAQAYVGVLRARRALAVAESSVASLRSHASDIAVMFEKEAVPKADLLGANVALANAEQERLRAANGVRVALAAYNRLIGEPLERNPELESPSPVLTADTGSALDALTAQAMDRRPEIAVLAARQKGFEEEARMERARGLPQLALRADYNHFDNAILDRQNITSVGIGLQWRLFDSGQVAARTSAMLSRARSAAHARDDVRSQIALEVEAAALSREDAAARLKVASAAVEEAEENVRSTRELYGAGLATNTQVLQAEALRVVALTNLDGASFDLVMSGILLQRAVGAL